MSIETQLYGTLAALCPRTFPDFAPVGTQRPYITWQVIGGLSLRYVDNAAADKRNSIVQVNVWADTRLQAAALARQIEDALCAASLFTATPQGEPISDFDADVPVYGTQQDFDIYSTR